MIAVLRNCYVCESAEGKGVTANVRTESDKQRGPERKGSNLDRIRLEKR